MPTVRLLFNLASILLVLAAPASASALDFDVICPSILQPVCAESDGEARTFPNRCLAEGSGYAVLGSGNCDGTARLAQTVCTKEYLPVCGEKDGVRRTFGNECEARAEDFAVVADGEC